MDFLRNFFQGPQGSIGQALMQFYIKNALWLNFVVGGYFVLLIISRQKYKTTLDHLLSQCGYKTGKRIVGDDLWKLAKKIRSEQINWQSALLLDKFPFIALQHEYIFYPKTENTLRKLYSLERIEAMADLLDHRDGKKTAKDKHAS